MFMVSVFSLLLPMSFIGQVCTHEEFVKVTEAQQCNRMTATGHRQQNNNI